MFEWEEGFETYISPWNWNCNRKFYVLVAITSWYNLNTWSREMSSIKSHICHGFWTKIPLKSQILNLISDISLRTSFGRSEQTTASTVSSLWWPLPPSSSTSARSASSLTGGVRPSCHQTSMFRWNNTYFPKHSILRLSWLSVSGGGYISCVCDGVMG